MADVTSIYVTKITIQVPPGTDSADINRILEETIRSRDGWLPITQETEHVWPDINKKAVEEAIITGKAPHLHLPQQHRDGKEPWCESCGKNAQHEEPSTRFQFPDEIKDQTRESMPGGDPVDPMDLTGPEGEAFDRANFPPDN